jgi:hypothetical protein
MSSMAAISTWDAALWRGRRFVTANHQIPIGPGTRIKDTRGSIVQESAKLILAHLHAQSINISWAAEGEDVGG